MALQPIGCCLFTLLLFSYFLWGASYLAMTMQPDGCCYDNSVIAALRLIVDFHLWTFKCEKFNDDMYGEKKGYIRDMYILIYVYY